MRRTTIMLSERLKTQIELRARDEGVSFAEWIRRAAADALDHEKVSGRRDPLMRDEAVFNGDAPTDLAQNHDVYLYGDS